MVYNAISILRKGWSLNYGHKSKKSTRLYGGNGTHRTAEPFKWSKSFIWWNLNAMDR